MKKKNGKVYVFVVVLFIIAVGTSNRVLAQSDTRFEWKAWPEKDGHHPLRAVLFQPWSGDRGIRICIFNPEEKKVEIKITNGTDVDFSFTMREIHFDQVFNFDQIDDGKYKIEITADRETITKDILLSTATLTSRRIVMD